MTPVRLRPFLTVAVVASIGCAGNQPQVGGIQCEPTTGRLAASTTAAGLAGEYRLTMVATSGGTAGQRTDGLLTLVPHDSTMRQYVLPDGRRDPTVTLPLYGTAAIELDSVGALQVGELGSMNPASPGVAVIEQRTDTQGQPGTDITLRLGSITNRRDILRFDGGYTALYVRSISTNGFAGDWRSGGGRGRTVEGYFCAGRGEL